MYFIFSVDFTKFHAKGTGSAEGSIWGSIMDVTLAASYMQWHPHKLSMIVFTQKVLYGK